MMRLDQEISLRIRPSVAFARDVKCATDQLVEAIHQATKDTEGVMEIKVVGSVAKGTYVSRPDIDVFIIFSENIPRTKMDEVGLKVGRELLVDREERYAEHPYVHGMFHGFEADIVPCYGIKDPSKLISAVDRTPFHTDYMLAHLRSEQKDDVRTLKQFLKGIGAYGAEAKVQGFSGYLVELLILKYGDFQNVIVQASTWKFGVKLDVEGKGKNKFDGPMVFYDPVDNNRNVASALSVEKFAFFVHACNEYLKHPDVKFFFPEEKIFLDRDEINDIMRDLGFKLLVVRCERPELIDDNLYPQARKTLEGINSLLGHEGFIILDKVLHVDKIHVSLVFLLEHDELSESRKHIGPPVWMENSQEFLRRWRAEASFPPFIEGGRWVAFVKRRFVTAKEAVEGGLASAALGSLFKNASMKIYDDEEARNDGLEPSLTVLLDKRMPWETKEKN
jgi:tRNA nucleotidyltransferase (CCA-adding enzyme)